jgi:chromosome segregation protein
MRLKNIKLAGFKSFVDPTTIPFTKNLIAIVGPNGCGKSNVVDAIRWVMGEASAKNLRGSSMEDVIFNGSSARKPVSQASVQLTFDNSDASIGGEYAQYAEIAIKRVASRDGTSQYYLNNTKCRRKDITELFLGTGVGPRSYSLIEQGMISRFIEAKPEDLRIFLEEAAGISKYKERRRETETRIRHTRENLDRVEDLCKEIGMQLEKLQRQAKAAERYKILQEEERLNKAQLLALQWQLLDTELKTFADVITQTELVIEERLAKQRNVGVQIEQHRERQIELSDELNDVQGRYYSLGAEIAKIEQSITHYRERYQQLQEDNLRLQTSTDELQDSKQQDALRLQELQSELLILEPEFDAAKTARILADEAFMDVEMQLTDWREEWETFNSQTAKALQTAEVEQTRIRHTERMITDLKIRIEKLTTEQVQLDDAELQLAVEEIALTEQSVLVERNTLQERIEQVVAALNQKRQISDALNQELDTIKEKLQAAKGQQASLVALQQAALGKQNAMLTQWLEKNDLANKPRLAQQLTVESGWEKAVETVLGPHLEAICVDSLAGLESLLAEIPNGNIEFLNISTSAANVSNRVSLFQKVTGANALSPYLSKVYCADSLAQARDMLPGLTDADSVITQEGLWLAKNWIRVAKEEDQTSGVLQRERDLHTVNEVISELTAHVSELQTQLIETKQAILATEDERETVQNHFNHMNQRVADVRTQLQVKKQILEQQKLRIDRINRELEEQRHKLTEQQAEYHAARDNWEQAITTSETLASQREPLETKGNHYREQVSRLREQVQLNANQQHQLEVRIEQIKPQTKSLTEAIARTEKQLQLLWARGAEISAALENGEGPIAELQEQLEALLERRLLVEKQLQDVRAKVDAVNHQLRELEHSKDDLNQDVEEYRRNLEQHRLEGRTLDVRKNNYLEQITASEFQLETLLQEMPSEASIPVWQEQAEQIALRIQRLGPINLAAIEEYKTEQERKDYLDAQCNDLQEALSILENAIEKIDKETRARFKETFDKVNEGFQQLFPRVFGGGSAYLEMIGDDLLDTGISVMARPPGKRNSTIHLLSGGEKALTAVSLVFSIFQLNPAPFCLLDEVDAPLDDANVGRFCQLVKEMSQKVQFLFISHNKLAIEMADQLTGVTMHEPGVSRIVAVDVEEAVKLATQ